MKKLIALCTIAIAACVFTGCGKPEAKITPAPQVSEAKVNDATKAYVEAVKAVVAVTGSTDAGKITAATTKYSEATTKLMSSMEGLKEEDSTKITTWMQTVATEMATAVQAK